jgi:cardiolipin synthase
MNRSDIPNIISILRIILVIPTIVLLFHERYGQALVLFAVAGASDGLDGYIAKRFNYVSRLGTILDPLADKLLLVSTYVTLAWLGLLPAWLVIAVIARDALIVSGGIAYHYLIGQYDMAPTLISKINTLTQIVLALAVVLSVSVLPLPELQWFVGWMIYITLGTTAISGVDYVWTWGLRAYRARSRRHYG